MRVYSGLGRLTWSLQFFLFVWRYFVVLVAFRGTGVLFVVFGVVMGIDMREVYDLDV